MVIRKVALIGAGAVGAYFIEGLADRPDIRFTVVADGERFDRLRTHGIRINGRERKPELMQPQEVGEADLIIIAVKYGAIEEAAEMAAMMTGEGTIVLSVLNGIDSEEIVGRTVGSEHMLYSIMRIQSWRNDDEILFDPEGTGGLFFGEKDHKERTERVLAIEELFLGSGVRCTFIPDIQGEIWSKYASNIRSNIPQAILGVGYGVFEDSEHARWIKDSLNAEVVAVAGALGIIIPPLTANAAAARQLVQKSARFSTLQDLDAHRHTEVEMLLGVLIRLAGELDVPVPFSTMCYHLVKALEEKNDGRFDYEKGIG